MSGRFGHIASGKKLRFVVPAVLFGIFTYLTWTYCHKLCYDEIYINRQEHGTAVGLMFTEIFLTLALFTAWLQLVLVKAGRQPKLLPYYILRDDYARIEEDPSSLNSSRLDMIFPPKVYPCDPQGYPIWCSECQSVKDHRTHHSSMLGYCVPRFDHYCVWVGSIIGRKNYKLFVQYMFFGTMWAILVVTSIACYLDDILLRRHHIPRINPNILICFGLSCIGLLMIFPLFVSHCYYMATNRTSIEVLQTKRRASWRKLWFCYYRAQDNCRYVLEFSPKETQRCYRKSSIFQNIKEFMGSNVLTWIIPIGTNIKCTEPELNEYKEILGPYLETVSDQFEKMIEERIQAGQYVKTLHVYGDKLKEISE
ncbi:LAMI_0G10726g1_1 [Lachancea mirantina]|uniref:Palmitoyltransferase n=1 Tax=Lachancea mirantina TaxID=1230905 RepID=A0A1G4KAZ6_9SACH|nr:LAMI_0G10726g1_1 [Lachancea mirantina]